MIELLLVVAIVGILAAVLIPNLLTARTRGFDTLAVSCAKAISTAQEVEWIDSETYAASLGDLDPDLVSPCQGGVAPIFVDTSSAFNGPGWEVSHLSGSGTVFTVGPRGLN